MSFRAWIWNRALRAEARASEKKKRARLHRTSRARDRGPSLKAISCPNIISQFLNIDFVVFLAF